MAPKTKPIHIKSKYANITEFSQGDKRGIKIALKKKYTGDHLGDVTRTAVEAWGDTLRVHPDYNGTIEFDIIGESSKKRSVQVSKEQMDELQTAIVSSAIYQTSAYTARKEYEASLTRGQKVKYWFKNHWKDIVKVGAIMAGGWVVGIFGPLAYAAYSLTTLGIGKALNKPGNILDYKAAADHLGSDMSAAQTSMTTAQTEMSTAQEAMNNTFNQFGNENYSQLASQGGGIPDESELGQQITAGNTAYDQAWANYQTSNTNNQTAQGQYSQSATDLNNLQGNMLTTVVNGIATCVGIGIAAYSIYSLAKSIYRSKQLDKNMILLREEINTHKSKYVELIAKAPVPASEIALAQ